MTLSETSFASGNRTGLGIAYGAGAGALWGLVFLAPELASAFSPLQLAIGRYLAYGAISLALIAPRWRTLAVKISRRVWATLALLALSGNTLYYVLLATAVQLGGIAMTSLIIAFLPVAVTIIGSRERGAVPLSSLALSLLLCAAGVSCIGYQAFAGQPDQGVAGGIAGFACAVGALACWTSFAVYNSRAIRRLKEVSTGDWNLLTGVMSGTQAALLVPLALLVYPQRHTSAEWALLGCICVGVALVASIAANDLWNRMSKLLPLTMAGQMILFETLFALIYGFVWEHRLPHAIEVAAFALVIASVVICISAHRRHAVKQALF